MARRSRTIWDVLVTFPWWINIILAVVVYFSFKYLIPSIQFQNPFFKGVATFLPFIAPVIAGMIVFIAALSAYSAWRKGELLERQTDIQSLRAINWREFEELVGEAYRRKGYGVAEQGGGGADGGVDLVVRKNGEVLLVQCKHWRMEKVGVKVVRELYGVVAADGASGGVVISSGRFTKEARDFARGKPLELIDGTELLRMVAGVKNSPVSRSGETQHQFGPPAVTESHARAQSFDATDGMNPAEPDTSKPVTGQACPLCGGEMVLRTARKGPKAGERFWGCSSFPKCRGVKPYSG